MPADLAVVDGWIEQYNLGRPIAYRASTWCSYREQPDGSWYDDPALCPAAPIFRLGIYLINDVSWFFQGVQSVQVQQARIFTGRPTADNAQLSIQYTDGALGSIFCSFCIDDRLFYRTALELNFERGTITRNLGVFEENLARGKTSLALSAADGKQQLIARQELDAAGAGYQWDVFYQAVRHQPLPPLIRNEMIVSAIQIIEKL
jgi:predicted dehydrogenase